MYPCDLGRRVPGWFVGGGWWAGCMPRRRDPQSPKVVYRTARAGLRVTRGQRRRLLGLLISAGDVWACVLEINAWRRARQDRPLASYQELCRELAASGPGCFGELDTEGARSVLRRYSDAWFAAAQRRRSGDQRARFPRRRRALMPLRWYYGTFALTGRVLRIPVARGRPALQVRLDRDLPYPPGQVRSVTLVHDAGRLWVDVTAEVPVAFYPAGQEPDPDLVAGVDLGIIHPYAVAGRDGQGLLVSGRAIRAEHRMHLADTKARSRAVTRRAPKPGQKGSRRWRHYRRRQRAAEARHRRRVRQAQHEAAKTVITWAVDRRIGTLAVGDPRGVLNVEAGRRHNQRTRDWRIGHLITALKDKAEAAGIGVLLIDERGTSSTCPACRSRIPKPAGRVLTCPACQFTGHRDLSAAANIAARAGGGTTPVVPAGVTHRRAGAHLPVSPPRDVTHAAAPITAAPAGPLAGTGPPAPAPPGLARESHATLARSLNTARNYRQVHYAGGVPVVVVVPAALHPAGDHLPLEADLGRVSPACLPSARSACSKGPRAPDVAGTALRHRLERRPAPVRQPPRVGEHQPLGLRETGVRRCNGGHIAPQLPRHPLCDHEMALGREIEDGGRVGSTAPAGPGSPPGSPAPASRRPAPAREPRAGPPGWEPGHHGTQGESEQPPGGRRDREHPHHPVPPVGLRPARRPARWPRAHFPVRRNSERQMNGRPGRQSRRPPAGPRRGAECGIHCVSSTATRRCVTGPPGGHRPSTTCPPGGSARPPLAHRAALLAHHQPSGGTARPRPPARGAAWGEGSAL